MTIQTSGENRNYETGASRDQNNTKGRFDLLPPLALKRVARHYQAGADIRGRRNWELGMPVADMLDSSIRHIYEYIADRVLQREPKEDNLAAAAWNLLGAIETLERIGLGNLPEDLDNILGELVEREPF